MGNDFEFDLGDMLQQQIMQKFGDENTQNATYETGNDRLDEMIKKLPSWSLEPPFGFLK